MNYDKIIAYLYNAIPNYQKYGAKDFKPGLDKIESLLNALNNPGKSLRYIHIAGTNGKGSTCKFLNEILVKSGYKTGLFTSPHLFDFRERIQINNELITKEFIIDYFEKHQAVFDELQPSFFELTFAIALAYFEYSETSICVIETGLGGRLDATNCIQPDICGITNISLEHTEFLGHSIKKIAAEKGGIIKENIPVVLGEMLPEAKAILKDIAKERNSELVSLKYWEEEIFGYQQDNLNMAKSILEHLKLKGWSAIDLNISAEHLHIPGRFQILTDKPKIIIDVAHNSAGFQTLFAQKELIEAKELTILYGGTKDKDLNEILQSFPINSEVVFTSFSNTRTLKEEDFKAQEIIRKYEYFENAQDAYSSIVRNLREDQTLLICGSFYLLSDLKPLLDLQS